jgi:plastocyanin
MIRIRGVMAAVAMIVAAATAGRAEDPFTVDVTLKDHVFDPSTIKVPAGKPILIRLKNLDPTAEEFDSTALKIEKVIAGRGEGTVRLRPLDPGQYPFIGEYNESTAKGVVIAE